MRKYFRGLSSMQFVVESKCHGYSDYYILCTRAIAVYVVHIKHAEEYNTRLATHILAHDQDQFMNMHIAIWNDKVIKYNNKGKRITTLKIFCTGITIQELNAELLFMIISSFEMFFVNSSLRNTKSNTVAHTYIFILT